MGMMTSILRPPAYRLHSILEKCIELTEAASVQLHMHIRMVDIYLQLYYIPMKVEETCIVADNSPYVEV